MSHSRARVFPRVWENASPWNFDNFGQALVTVFVATTGETWPDIMYDCVLASTDAKTGTAMQSVGSAFPSHDSANFVVAPLYFMFLTIVCGFLLMNVIVGVIIDEYAKQKEKLWILNRNPYRIPKRLPNVGDQRRATKMLLRNVSQMLTK